MCESVHVQTLTLSWCECVVTEMLPTGHCVCVCVFHWITSSGMCKHTQEKHDSLLSEQEHAEEKLTAENNHSKQIFMKEK